MPDPIAANFLDSARKTFAAYKTLGDKAFAQLPDDADYGRAIGAESNSIAVIVKHLRGNMRSRWTDYLTTDGEKPDRRRDEEFEPGGGVTRAEVVGWWEEGWGYLTAALGALTPEDLGRTVRLRGEPLTVVEAINRQMAHAAYHVGQVVYLAKQWRGEGFESLSIPRKK